MSNLRHAARVDRNQKRIVDALVQAGCSVCHLKGEKGLPDLLVGRRGLTYLLEVKTETGKLNAAQIDWHQHWRGRPPVVVRTRREALEAVGIGT